MPCCGQGRAALARTLTRPAEAPRAAIPPPPRPEAVGARVLLRYLARAPIALRGAASGAEYRFDATRAEQTVDARDAEALLRTRFFRRMD